MHRKFNQLEARCCRESQHSAERAIRPPIEQLQLERRCWNEEHVPERLSPRPSVEQPRRTEKKRRCGHKSGGQYVAVLFGLQLLLTHNPFNKVRGIFSKELFRSSLLCCRYDSACICVCIVGHGYTRQNRPQTRQPPGNRGQPYQRSWTLPKSLSQCLTSLKGGNY